MITMTLKVNKKRLRNCVYKSYTSFKDLFKFIIVRNGFKAKGKGIFTREEYPTTEMFRTIIPVIKYFEEEVMPEIRALRHVIATQAMAKRKMLMKQCQKTKPEPEEPPAVTATVILNEFPRHEEVPF